MCPIRILVLVCLLSTATSLIAKNKIKTNASAEPLAWGADTYTRTLLLDTIKQELAKKDTTDKVLKVEDNKSVEAVGKKEGRIAPGTLVAISAVLPGFGQIYNGAYWKAPIVWGLIGTALYFTIVSNSNMVAANDVFQSNRVEQYRKLRDNYRKERDDRILLVVLACALSLIDVYVDAQLSTFEVKDVRQTETSSMNQIPVEATMLNFSIVNFKVRF